jgi:HTH-type transcriptional regulator/antitoxin HipB
MWYKSEEMKRALRDAAQLGAEIRKARRAQQLTQAQLGERAGMRQKLVSAIERGEPGTRIENIFALVNALHMELVAMPRSQSDLNDLEEIF